jgi:uncharacterized protein YjiS (DUF1127 family)
MHFSPSCSATKFLFKRQISPILWVNRVTGEGLNLPSRLNYREKEIPMFASVVRFIQSWKNYNRSLSELNRLGDRELADIGISRSDIPRLAWSAAQHR